jgi:uncharacterized membrane protein
MGRDTEGSCSLTVGKNVQAIADVELAALRRRSVGERFGDRVAARAGSINFVLFHAAWFVLWILVNANAIPGVPAFDPYPFAFLTLVVSLEAIFLSIFVLVSQNRMSRQAELRGHLDLQVNLLAEQESTAALHLLKTLCEHLGIDAATRSEDQRLLDKTNIKEILTELQGTLPDEAHHAPDANGIVNATELKSSPHKGEEP